MILFKDLMADPKHQERVAQIKTNRENYDPKKWEEVKAKFVTKDFPDDYVENRLLLDKNKNPNKGEYHIVGSSNHSLHSYSVMGKTEGFGIEWTYNYCGICGKVINKKAILLNDYENVACVKWFVRKGENVTRKSDQTFELRPSLLTQNKNIDAVVDSLNTPLAGLEGGDLDGNN